MYLLMCIYLYLRSVVRVAAVFTATPAEEHILTVIRIDRELHQKINIGDESIGLRTKCENL